MTTTSPKARTHQAAAALALTMALTAAHAGAGGRQPWDPDAIVGVWESQVTQRVCATGAVIASFKGMQVFHHGGTLTDTNTAGPTSRGPGFGVWARDGSQVVARFRFARYFPDGNLAGFSVVTRTVTLAPDGNNATSETVAQLTDPAGSVFATVCASDTSSRFFR